MLSVLENGEYRVALVPKESSNATEETFSIKRANLVQLTFGPIDLLGIWIYLLIEKKYLDREWEMRNLLHGKLDRWVGAKKSWRSVGCLKVARV